MIAYPTVHRHDLRRHTPSAVLVALLVLVVGCISKKDNDDPAPAAASSAAPAAAETDPGVLLLSPGDASATSDNTPTFSWSAASGGGSYTYRFQMDDNPNFAEPILNIDMGGGTSYSTTSPLPDDAYYWRVLVTAPSGTVFHARNNAFLLTIDACRFDFDRDGYDDVIIPASGCDVDAADAGRVYVVRGGPTLSGAIGAADAEWIFTGEAAGDNFGRTARSAGDVNRDGYDDLLVGSPNNDSAGANAGRVYLFYGSAVPVALRAAADADVIFAGEASGDNLGPSAGAGDVNADGLDDILLGASGNDAGGAGAGRAYLFYGSRGMSGLVAAVDADVVITGEAAGDGFGVCDGAGDVNADGADDFLLGAPSNAAGGANAGRVYLFYGFATRLGFYAGVDADVIVTGAAGSQLGIVAGAGDVNGDGLADILMGALSESTVGSNAGAVGLVLGSTALPAAIAAADMDVTILGEAAEDRLCMVSIAGDVNGDGLDDILLGAPANDGGGGDSGRAYIVFGSPVPAGVRSAADSDVIFTGEAAGDLFGLVSSAGDVNGDGYADVAIGAPNSDAGGNDAGRGYVFYGSASPTAAIGAAAADVIVTGEGGGDNLGCYVCAARSSAPVGPAGILLALAALLAILRRPSAP